MLFPFSLQQVTFLQYDGHMTRYRFIILVIQIDHPVIGINGQLAAVQCSIPGLIGRIVGHEYQVAPAIEYLQADLRIEIQVLDDPGIVVAIPVG